MFATSVRHALGAVTAALLSLTGLVFVATPSYAASPYVALMTLSPDTAAFGSTVIYHLDIYGTDNTTANKASLLKVQVPTGFTDVVPFQGSYSHPTGWNTAVDYSSATHLLTFTASNAATDLDQGDHIHLDVQAKAAASGQQAWTLTAFRGIDVTSQILSSQSPAPELVTGGDQHLSFSHLSDRTYGDGDFVVNATSDGPGPISYSSETTSTCTVGSTNGSVHIVSAGGCTITAHQAAATGYSAALDVSQAFTIAKATQAITFPAVDAHTFGDADFDVAATASSGLDVTFSASGGNCTVSGRTVSIVHAGNCTITAAQAGNANYTAATDSSQTFSISPKAAAVTLHGLDATYDGHQHGVTVTTEPVGLESEVTLTYDGSTAEPTDAHAYKVVATIDDPDYSVQEVTQTFTIAPRTVTGHLTVAGRPYDGTTDAEVLTETLTGTVAGDDVSLTGGAASFGSPDAGARTATLTGAGLSGTAAHNYVLDDSDPITTTAAIWPRQITGSITAGAKTYDGTTGVPDGILSGSLDDVIGSDDVTLEIVSASYTDRSVGTQTINAQIALAGAKRANYALTDTSLTTPGVITARHVTGSFTAGDKVYDGTTTASVTGSQLDNAIEKDDVSLVVGIATFDDKNVGEQKTVRAELSLTGADAGNYVLPGTDPATTTADITAKSVTGSFTSSDKVYDGGTSAAANGRALTGVLGDDDVTLTGGTASFADKTVGTGKTVTLTGATLDGDDAGNYDLTSVDTTTADITAKQLTATVTADDKIYDDTTTATVHPTLGGVVAGDTVSAGATGTFSSKYVGTWDVTASVSISGDDAGNYTLTGGPWRTTASIRPLYLGTGFYKPVDMTPFGSTIVYNSVKGGQTVPLKFEVFANGTEQKSVTDVFGDTTAQAAAFRVAQISCSPYGSVGDVDFTTTGGTALRFDSTADQFVQNWKTPTQLGCYSVTVKAKDGGTTLGPAYFKITK